jgi:hypothetical protein
MPNFVLVEKEDENFNHRNTLPYFEDLNLSLTSILGQKGVFSKGLLQSETL